MSGAAEVGHSEQQCCAQNDAQLLLAAGRSPSRTHAHIDVYRLDRPLAFSPGPSVGGPWDGRGVDFSMNDSVEFQGQFLDLEEVAPDELRTVLLAFNPSPPAITRQLNTDEDDQRAWLLLARAAHGLVVVVGSGEKWTVESRTRPANAAVEADWYPLDAMQRVSIAESKLELTSQLSAGRFELEVAWAIHIAGRNDPLILKSNSGGVNAVDDFVRGLLRDRARLGLGCVHASHTSTTPSSQRLDARKPGDTG